MKLVNKKNKETVVSELKVAKSFGDRMIGLMFEPKMDGFNGLLIEQCNSVHTFFMKYPIHVYFLNKELEVIKKNEFLKPWRITPMCFGAVKVLELDAREESPKIEIGDELELCTN